MKEPLGLVVCPLSYSLVRIPAVWTFTFSSWVLSKEIFFSQICVTRQDSRISDRPWRQQQLRSPVGGRSAGEPHSAGLSAVMRVRWFPRGRGSPAFPELLQSPSLLLTAARPGGPAARREEAGLPTWRLAVLTEGVSGRTGGAPAPPPPERNTDSCLRLQVNNNISSIHQRRRGGSLSLIFVSLSMVSVIHENNGDAFRSHFVRRKRDI